MSSSQKIVPHNSASLAKSLTIEFTPSGKPFIYIKNNSGPKTVHWGTPDVVTTGVDDSPQLPLIGYAVLETIRPSYVIGDEELCRMLLKNRGLRRELFSWTG